MGVCFCLVDTKNKRIFDLDEGMDIYDWINANSVQDLKNIISQARIKHVKYYIQPIQYEVLQEILIDLESEIKELKTEYWYNVIADIWAFIQISGKENVELRHDHVDYYEKDPDYPFEYIICYARCWEPDLKLDPFAEQHKIIKEQALKELRAIQ